MTFNEYVVGVADLLCLFGLIGAAAWLFVRNRLPYLSGVDRVLAVTTVFTAGLIMSHVIPLSLGVLSRASVLLTALVSSAVAVLFSRAHRPTLERPSAYP